MADYVLGTDRDELDRLGLQHRLWSDAAHALWLRARVRPGSRVLDVGCGPGYAAFDLAGLVTGGGLPGIPEGGLVVAVDASERFVATVRQQAEARGLRQLDARTGDVTALPALLPEHLGRFDFAWARWVLCFVPDPAAVLAGVAAMLAPGGRLGVHDYFNYQAMTTAPRRASHDRVVAATIASWRAHGGDPDICGRLPELLDAVGMDVVHLAVHQRVARPGDSMFHWTDTWWRGYAPKLVAMGFLGADDCAALLADLDEIRASRTEYVWPPPVTELLAVKR